MYIDELNQKHSKYNAAANKEANKKNILAQNAKRSPRIFKLRWLLAVSTIPLFGVYAAFGIAPKTETLHLRTTATSEEVALPTPQKLSTTNNLRFIYKEHVRRDDTINSIFVRLNISNRKAMQFIRDQITNNTDSKKLIVGQTISATVDNQGNLHKLEYQHSPEQSIQIKRVSGGKYSAETQATRLEKRTVLKSAIINRSLFASTDQANIPDNIATQIINIFENEINFHKDIRKGDQLKVIYEAHYNKGKVVKSGNVLAIEFHNKNKVHHAIGFANKQGEMEYFTPLGKTLNKSFLRSPLAFTRVSSSFSLGRFHPVLQRIRAHKGVDLAAPTGTKIRATGDAIVKFVGFKGGYGRVIELKHDNGVKTVYGHLSRFAKHLKKGKKVEQGQLIGYVGKSGLATGPHLHYEFLLNGKHRDPMKVKLPKSKAIHAKDKVQFLQASRHLMTKIQLLENTNIAALD